MSMLEPMIDADSDVANVVTLIALDLPRPERMAMGLEMQFRRVASLLVAAVRTEQGFRVNAHYRDERVEVLRSFGLLPWIGEQPSRECVAAGFYLTAYARLVRRQIILLRAGAR